MAKRSKVETRIDTATDTNSDVVLLDVQHQFQYRHSLGKVSKFFDALEEKKLLATRCEGCGGVYMPPRTLCPKDLKPTSWIELSGEGTLESWTLCPYPPNYVKTDNPYVLAYVRLDGTNSSFLHQLRFADADNLEYGMKIKTVFGDFATKHPLELFWFELS